MKSLVKSVSVSAFILCLFLLPANLSAQKLSINNKDKSKQLDFMLGDWKLVAKIRVSPIAFIEGIGSMKVSVDKDTGYLLADTKVKFQNFEVDGVTKRIFDKNKERWNVSWNPVNQQGVPNIEGQMLNGRFIEVDYGKDNYGAYIGRLIVFNITNDKFSVRKDQLYDDGTLMNEVWRYEATRIKDKK